jgi:hypothetical protein
MESELKKIQDIAIKADNGVMEDQKADEAIREILGKYGLPQKITAKRLYHTRLIHAERETSKGHKQENIDTMAEHFLAKEWSRAYVRSVQNGIIGKLKDKYRENQNDDKLTLYDLVAESFLLLLQGAADWSKVYIRPLKEALTGSEHTYGYAVSVWSASTVGKISGADLKKCFEALPADAPLKKVIPSYDGNEQALRIHLSAKDQGNEYLNAARNFVIKGIKNDEDVPEEDKKIADEINSDPAPKRAYIRVVSEFLKNWECGLGWLDAPNKRSEKLPYRVIRHLFFLILGLNDPLYGSAEDMRTLLIQLGFALGMKSTEIDELLKDSGLSGLAYNTNEIILAYAADHFDDNAYLHARALQKIYEVQSQIVPQNKAGKPDTLELKQTAFFRYNYKNYGWSELEPADFLQQCRDDNIAWRRVQDLIDPPKQRKKSSLEVEAANEELQESSEQRTNIVVYSSQLFEIRKILIDLYLMTKIREENRDKKKEAPWRSQYNEIKLAYENKLLSLDHSTDFSEESAGWKKFLEWNKPLAGNFSYKSELYPFCANELNKNGEPINTRVIYEKIKNAQTCLKTGRWLLRDDFLRLAFLDYLTTEPPETLRSKKAIEIVQSFADKEGPILERCRLKPYDPDKDALTQDFIRTLENKEKNQ